MEKKKRNSIAFGLILVVIVALLIGFSGDGSYGESSTKKEEVKMGVVTPLSGPLTFFGEGAKRGTEIAAEEINSENGINGNNITLVYGDSKGSPKDGVSETKKLIETDGVKAIIGSVMSSVAVPVYEVAEEKNVIMMPAGVGTETLSKNSPLFYRVWMRDKIRAEKTANKMSAEEINKVAIMHVNDEWGNTMKKGFEEEFKKEGNITSIETFNPDNTDFSSQVAKLKSSNPDAIYLASIKNIGRIIDEINKLGVDAPIFIAADIYAIKAQIGNKSEDLMGLGIKNENNKVRENFKQKFKDKYGKNPGPFAPYAYDALKLLEKSMENCGTKTKQIKKCLNKVEEYKGASGEIAFDENGNAIRDTEFLQVENGTIKPYR